MRALSTAIIPDAAPEVAVLPVGRFVPVLLIEFGPAVPAGGVVAVVDPVVVPPVARSIARPAAVPGGLFPVPSGSVRLPVAESSARCVAVEGGLPGVPSVRLAAPGRASEPEVATLFGALPVSEPVVAAPRAAGIPPVVPCWGVVWVVPCTWLLPPVFCCPKASSGAAHKAAAVVIIRTYLVLVMAFRLLALLVRDGTQCRAMRLRFEHEASDHARKGRRRGSAVAERRS
jgi:hypothetical protein